MAIAVLLVHTYFGFFAERRAIRVSGSRWVTPFELLSIVVISVTLLVSSSIYGSNGNFNLSG